MGEIGACRVAIAQGDNRNGEFAIAGNAHPTILRRVSLRAKDDRPFVRVAGAFPLTPITDRQSAIISAICPRIGEKRIFGKFINCPDKLTKKFAKIKICNLSEL